MRVLIKTFLDKSCKRRHAPLSQRVFSVKEYILIVKVYTFPKVRMILVKENYISLPQMIVRNQDKIHDLERKFVFYFRHKTKFII